MSRFNTAPLRGFELRKLFGMLHRGHLANPGLKLKTLMHKTLQGPADTLDSNPQDQT